MLISSLVAHSMYELMTRHKAVCLLSGDLPSDGRLAAFSQQFHAVAPAEPGASVATSRHVPQSQQEPHQELACTVPGGPAGHRAPQPLDILHINCNTDRG